MALPGAKVVESELLFGDAFEAAHTGRLLGIDLLFYYAIGGRGNQGCRWPKLCSGANRDPSHPVFDGYTLCMLGIACAERRCQVSILCAVGGE